GRECPCSRSWWRRFDASSRASRSAWCSSRRGCSSRCRSTSEQVLALSFLGGLLDSNEAELRRLRKVVARVSALEPDWEKRSDAELADSTPRLRDRPAKGEPVDDVLPEAYAAVREAGNRTLKPGTVDVQPMRGLVP